MAGSSGTEVRGCRPGHSGAEQGIVGNDVRVQVRCMVVKEEERRSLTPVSD